MSQNVTTETEQRHREDTVLEVSNLNVSYEMTRGRAQVLNGVSFDVFRGETLGIVGESGSGKSMLATALMNAIRGQGTIRGEVTYTPESGPSVDILQLNTRELKRIRWESISMVYQGAMSGFNPVLKMRSHFTETFAAHDVDKQAGMEEARELVQEMGLEPGRVLETYPNELSGGEKQRLMLALSLVFDPDVLILDEPTDGLDIVTRRSILKTLVELKDEHDMTMIFISHDVTVASAIADRLATMYAFEMVETGPVEEVLMRPEHPYTRMMLRAGLDLEKPPETAVPIDGDTPDPINLPSGCSYHPRCPIAEERCEVEDPELRSEHGSTHEVACFYSDEAVETIDLPDQTGDEVEE